MAVVNVGNLALVGSGEYTNSMQALESELVAAGVRRGKKNAFVQIAAAAGLESSESIAYWKNLGAAQAERIGSEAIFLDIYREGDADTSRFNEVITSAGLIYFSGGNPLHLAKVMNQTPTLHAILDAWKSGSSLAGCSAGAMAMVEKVTFGFRRNNEATNGFGLLPKTSIYPHFDRYFAPKKLPLFKLIPPHAEIESLIGIDENTALVFKDNRFTVFGRGAVHILKHPQLTSSEKFTERNMDDQSLQLIMRNF